ncbi:hypothetical protein [Chromobacterium violaceum]|uniref:hypothetical protein n=1 Tax=Chromobacterium violaceum TaxID=536 RepID=UPI00111C1BEA|nr:hypothetical protein [Chromobacterium violaceum]
MEHLPAAVKAEQPSLGEAALVYQPARRIVAPTGGIIRGRFPSTMAGRVLSFEQRLERDALYLSVSGLISLSTQTRIYQPLMDDDGHNGTRNHHERFFSHAYVLK